MIRYDHTPLISQSPRTSCGYQVLYVAGTLFCGITAVVLLPASLSGWMLYNTTQECAYEKGGAHTVIETAAKIIALPLFCASRCYEGATGHEQTVFFR